MLKGVNCLQARATGFMLGQSATVRLFVQSAQWSLSRMSATSWEVLDKTGPRFESHWGQSMAARVVYLPMLSL